MEKRSQWLVFLCPGCPRVAGDEETFAADDSDEEFPIKNHHDDSDKQNVLNHSVISTNQYHL